MVNPWLNGQTLGSIERVMVDDQGEVVAMPEPPASIAVVRDADGQIIGKLVDRKVYGLVLAKKLGN